MAKSRFIVDGGIVTYGDSYLDGDVYVDGDVILSDGSSLVTDSPTAKIDFARILDMNGHRLMNVGTQDHPYDLASKSALEAAISNNITDVSQIQLDKLTALNTLLDDPANLTEVTTSIDEKISVVDLGTKIDDAKAAVEQNILDAINLSYGELNAGKTAIEQELATKQATLATMDTTYQEKLSQFQTLTANLTTSFNTIVATARAYMDSEIDKVINLAPPSLDTIHEVAARLGAIEDEVASTLGTQINAKASINYVDSTLANKANSELVLTWDDGTKQVYTNLEAWFKIHKIYANQFKGDGSQLYGLAAAGLFTSAWDRIVAMQQRLLEVQTIIGLAKTYESVTLVRTVDNPAAAGSDASFGNAVAISGSKIVVGAYNTTNETSSYSGRAYICEKNTGALTAIYNPVPSASDKFGNSVAINRVGDRILIGAQGKDDDATNAGKVYFADLNGNIIKSVSSPTPDAEDAFGYSVALTDDYAVVGSKYLDHALLEDAGGAHILNAMGSTSLIGNEIQSYSNPDITFQRYFGASVAARDNYVAIGAPSYELSDETGTSYRGNVSVYNTDIIGDNPVWRMDNPNTVGIGNINDNFGHSVAITKDYVIAGAPTDASQDFNEYPDSGSVYVMDKDTSLVMWAFGNPNDADTAQGDRFGYSVAADGDILVVGAPGEKNFSTGTQTGIVYIYNLRTGELLFTIRNPDSDQVAQFGYSVAIDVNTIVIGAPDTEGSRGRIYIYNLA